MINPVALQFPLFGNLISIHWYGIIIAVGMLLAILLTMQNAKREGLNPDNVLDLALVIVPMAIVGARLYYVIFMWQQIYSAGPFWKVFAVWEGGMAIYGGVIGGFIGICLYSRFSKNRIPLLKIADMIAPGLILAQAIGRWGNFVNQEAYGYAINNPAWQWFPAAVYIVADPEQPYHMATFFYESMWNLLVFLFLFLYYRKSKSRKTGDIFWFYLLLYGIGRVVIEGLRTDSLYLGATGIRVSQLLSGILIVVAAVMLIYTHIIRNRKPAEAAPLDDSLRLFREGQPAEEAEGAVEEPAQEPTGEEGVTPKTEG